jgi:dTDP-4-dehydrorhamnose reductase
MRVLLLGASGMLGNAVVRALSDRIDLEIYASLHTTQESYLRSQVSYVTCDVLEPSDLESLFEKIRPETVINCISPRRDALRSGDVLSIVPLCALLPHRIDMLCREFGSRFIHISTDGVFSGKRGFYTESDDPDPVDTYGYAKLLGEVSSLNSISLRTSMIGHEKGGGEGLLDWFLSQRDSCKCYRRAIFSGLPACMLAKIISDKVIDNKNLHGIYNVSAMPISKFDLLKTVVDVYKLPINIVPDDSLVIDRSLSPEKFRKATGFVAPAWRDMIEIMHADYLENMA